MRLKTSTAVAVLSYIQYFLFFLYTQSTPAVLVMTAPFLCRLDNVNGTSIQEYRASP